MIVILLLTFLSTWAFGSAVTHGWCRARHPFWDVGTKWLVVLLWPMYLAVIGPFLLVEDRTYRRLREGHVPKARIVSIRGKELIDPDVEAEREKDDWDPEYHGRG